MRVFGPALVQYNINFCISVLYIQNICMAYCEPAHQPSKMFLQHSPRPNIHVLGLVSQCGVSGFSRR